MAVDDPACIVELAGEQPDESSGGRGPRMGAVRRLIRRHRPKDAQEPRLFGPEALKVVLTSIHGSPFLRAPAPRAGDRLRFRSSPTRIPVRLRFATFCRRGVLKEPGEWFD